MTYEKTNARPFWIHLHRHMLPVIWVCFQIFMKFLFCWEKMCEKQQSECKLMLATHSDVLHCSALCAKELCVMVFQK